MSIERLTIESLEEAIVDIDGKKIKIKGQMSVHCNGLDHRELNSQLDAALGKEKADVYFEIRKIQQRGNMTEGPSNWTTSLRVLYGSYVETNE